MVIGAVLLLGSPDYFYGKLLLFTASPLIATLCTVNSNGKLLLQKVYR